MIAPVFVFVFQGGDLFLKFLFVIVSVFVFQGGDRGWGSWKALRSRQGFVERCLDSCTCLCLDEQTGLRLIKVEIVPGIILKYWYMIISGYHPLSNVYALMCKQVIQIVMYDQSTSAATKSNFPLNNSLENVLIDNRCWARKLGEPAVFVSRSIQRCRHHHHHHHCCHRQHHHYCHHCHHHNLRDHDEDMHRSQWWQSSGVWLCLFFCSSLLLSPIWSLGEDGDDGDIHN